MKIGNFRKFEQRVFDVFLGKNKKNTLNVQNFCNLQITKFSTQWKLGKDGQLSKRKRVLFWSIYIISLYL